jgi:hypothetical protein
MSQGLSVLRPAVSEAGSHRLVAAIWLQQDGVRVEIVPEPVYFKKPLVAALERHFADK